MRCVGLAAARGLLQRRRDGGACAESLMTIIRSSFSAVFTDASTSSCCSSSSSSSLLQHLQHQQRRTNFTGLPPRWYKSAGVEKDGEVSENRLIFCLLLLPKKKRARSVFSSSSFFPLSFSQQNNKKPKNAFAVTLDGKRLRTPARNPLVLPTRPLALAVAAEWAAQTSRGRPFTMPLMSLAATAIDEPAPREKVISTMISYLHTDGALVREEAGTALAQRQAEVFAPVVAWAERLAETPFVPSASVRGAPQSD